MPKSPSIPRRRHPYHAIYLGLALVSSAFGCNSSLERPEGWSEASHGKDVAPDYELLFSTEKVHTLQIVITPENYQTMNDDLASLMADSTGPGGDMQGGGQGPGGMQIPQELISACDSLNAGDSCQAMLQQTISGTCQPVEANLACIPSGRPGGMGMGMGGGVGGGTSLFSRDPIFVPAEVHYNDEVWSHVGIRYKGNSSLNSLSREGNRKLPFRITFDKYEDEYPETDDQRFYGFKKLTFSSNWSDDAMIRDAFVSEVLRDRGLPAARCAFYRIFVDAGEGSQYWGLYTLIEDPSDGAMLDEQLGGRGGNLYKPEGIGATWREFSEESFVKKSNEEEADWTDIQDAIVALHAEQSNPDTWRTNLEASFDIEHFLNWLAVNTAVVNWDSYGAMAHNYYLYAPLESSQLKWIPWDHNLSMTYGRPGMNNSSQPTQDAVTEVFHTQVSSQWPLIQLLLADPIYQDLYRDQLQRALGGLFESETAIARMRQLHTLITPYVVGEEGEVTGSTTISSESAFLEAIDGENGLAQHVIGRHQRVLEALESR